MPALARGMQILEFLAPRPEGATAATIAAAMRLPKPSVFRMLLTLLDAGYLNRDDDTHAYRLGRKLLTLGYAAVDEQGLIERSLDVLRALRDASRETALLAVLAGNDGVVLEQVAGPQAVKVVVQIGHRFPLHAAAPGKALLAHLPEAESQLLLTSLTYTRFNALTITSPVAMTAELAGVRRCGYALDRGEELDDIRCVAAPVLNHRAYPVAAIWVSGPASRIRDADFPRLGELVQAHAALISKRYM